MLSIYIARLSLHRAGSIASVGLRNDGRVRYAHAYKAKAFVPRPDGPNYLIVQHLLHGVYMSYLVRLPYSLLGNFASVRIRDRSEER